MPKVSIVMPAYNVEKYFRQCIESVINQTLEDIEIIPVDDGSPDNCGKIMDEYAAKDPRVKPIHQENGGYGKAVNAGINAAIGEYIAIVETDDYIDSNMYEELYKIAKQNDSDIVKSCFFENLDTPNEKSIKKVKWNNEIIPAETFTIKDCPLFLFYHPSIWSCIYKKEFLNIHNIRIIEAKGAGWTDNPFQVQTMCLAKKINYTPKSFYYWRKVNKNESDDLKDYTLPFERSNEIHEWIENHNELVTDSMLAALYLRELVYIKIVLGMPKICNLKSCFEKISSLCKRMDKSIILKSRNIPFEMKCFWSVCKYCPVLFYVVIQFRRHRQNLLSIRWNSKQKSIRFLGKMIYLKEEGGIC